MALVIRNGDASTRFFLRLPFQGVRKLTKKTLSGIRKLMAASLHPPTSPSVERAHKPTVLKLVDTLPRHQDPIWPMLVVETTDAP